ncbi:MAG: MarR family winged helix-turn-helix transcriptional regulator [Actinomycetota bacterium]|nr:MarR family winged helix-turn-helix transcriptional regulator [Actinomycetota bacterium]
MAGVQISDLERELNVLARRLVRPVQLLAGGTLDRADYLALGRLVDDGPMRLTTLAALLGLDLSVVSRQVRSLEAAGLATREPDPVDARAALVGATPQGHAALLETRRKRGEVLTGVLSAWPAGDRREFVRLLARFNHDLDAAISAHLNAHTAPAQAGTRA